MTQENLQLGGEPPHTASWSNHPLFLKINMESPHLGIAIAN